MTAATTRKPAIPAPPDGWRIVEGAVHTMLSVRLDDATVVYCYDTLSVTLHLLDNDQRLSATDLDAAIRTQSIPGRKVFRAELDCGGVLSDYHPPTVTGTAAEVSTLLEAVPYFYKDLQATEERKTLRAVHRYLEKHLHA